MLDLLLVLVVALAAVAGFRRSGDGATRTGRLVGLLLGAAIALPLSTWLAPVGTGAVSTGGHRRGGHHAARRLRSRDHRGRPATTTAVGV